MSGVPKADGSPVLEWRSVPLFNSDLACLERLRAAEAVCEAAGRLSDVCGRDRRHLGVEVRERIATLTHAVEAWRAAKEER